MLLNTPSKNKDGFYECEVCHKWVTPIGKHPRIQRWACPDCQDKLLQELERNDVNFKKLCPECQVEPNL